MKNNAQREFGEVFTPRRTVEEMFEKLSHINMGNGFSILDNSARGWGISGFCTWEKIGHYRKGFFK